MINKAFYQDTISNFLEDNSDNAFFIDYFDNFVKKLKNITFISFTNDIIDFKI